MRELTVGRLIISQILPEDMRPFDQYMTKKSISELVSECHKRHGNAATIQLLDDLKRLGFQYATRAGVTISITDMDIPAKRAYNHL